MESLNLYILSEGLGLERYPDYENALTDTFDKKQMKWEELETIRCLVKELMDAGVTMNQLDCFFYGFTIPQISKELDLLKIYNNGPILNLELKSRAVELDRIEKQLKQNRHYLLHLGKDIYSITYVMQEEKGLVYIYDGTSLKEGKLQDIIDVLQNNHQCVEDHVETLFRAKDFLISPLTTPDVFLEKNYYLTVQQENIKNRILKDIENNKVPFWGIMGGAGTGKTLLLYDIARELNTQSEVCIVHAGSLLPGHDYLKSKLTSLVIISNDDLKITSLDCFDYILVDESQRLSQDAFNYLLDAYKQRKGLIFAYDYYQVLSYSQKARNIPQQLSYYKDFKVGELSNKIRSNSEITSFILNVLNLHHYAKRRMNYHDIDVLYAKNKDVAKKIVEHYIKDKHYEYIAYTDQGGDFYQNHHLDTHNVIGQEYDQVIFTMDNHFKYNEEGLLQAKQHPNPNYMFEKLWYQGVTRAREKLCLVIVNNESLFNTILDIKLRKRKNRESL